MLLRNSFGVIPVWLLNTLLKCDCEQKPVSSAIVSMDSRPAAISLLAFSIRILVTYS